MEASELVGNRLQRVYSIQYPSEISMRLVSSEGNIEKVLMKVHPGDVLVVTRLIGGEKDLKKWQEKNKD